VEVVIITKKVNKGSFNQSHLEKSYIEETNAGDNSKGIKRNKDQRAKSK